MAWASVATKGKVRQDSKTGRWYIDLRPHARLFTYLAPWGKEEPFPSQAAAEKSLETIREWAMGGMGIPAAIERLRPREDSTVPALARQWIAAKRVQVAVGDRVGQSVDQLEYQTRRYWKHWDGVPIHEVRPRQIAEWVNGLRASGLAPPTVAGIVRKFHGFMSWLKEAELITDVPAFPEIKAGTRIRASLTWEQQDAIIAEVEPHLRGIFLAMACCALRPQEARAMLAVDLTPTLVRVRRAAKAAGVRAPIGPTKTAHERDLPMPAALWEWCEEFVSDEARVQGRLAFPSRAGRLWSQTMLAREWKAAAKRAGMPLVPMRDATRHSTAQEWRRRASADVGHIRDALGHAQERTTRVYLGAATAPLVSMVQARRKRDGR
jgi:integrase